MFQATRKTLKVLPAAGRKIRPISAAPCFFYKYTPKIPLEGARGIAYFCLTDAQGMTKRIVITGGPGTGKTVLVRELEKRGYSCFHEIIREMTEAAKKEEDPETHLVNPLTFVRDPLSFNRRILQGRMSQFRNAGLFQDPLVFFDRGIPDVLAYMDYFKQEYDGEFSEPCLNLRYDQVFLLPPWREIYTTDDERLESFEQACEIHECLDTTYRRYGYEVNTLDFGPVEDRVRQLFDRLNGVHE